MSQDSAGSRLKGRKWDSFVVVVKLWGKNSSEPERRVQLRAKARLPVERT